jgi:endoglucanase Acf2
LLIESSDEETVGLTVAELLEEVNRMELNADVPPDSLVLDHQSRFESTAAAQLEPCKTNSKSPVNSQIPSYITIPVVDGMEFAFSTSANVDPNTLTSASRPLELGN